MLPRILKRLIVGAAEVVARTRKAIFRVLVEVFGLCDRHDLQHLNHSYIFSSHRQFQSVYQLKQASLRSLYSIMLTSLRRCPASLRWKVVSKAVQFKSYEGTNSLLACQAIGPVTHKSVSSLRCFHQSAFLKREGAYAAAEEAEDGQQSYSEGGPPNAESDDATSQGPITKFRQLAERGLVNKFIINTLTEEMGLETMTEVQSLTISEAITGKDVYVARSMSSNSQLVANDISLAQARTGTGKTIGFLLPILQNILTEDPSLESARTGGKRAERGSNIRAIIISPTRELAEQIAAEAKRLTQGTGVVVQTAVGGTQKNAHLKSMRREGCHILVGTPGRLKDILSDEYSDVRAPNLSAFVLDEADRLLDQGFYPEIVEIQKLLPSRQEKDRQTLMFSATVSPEVVKLVRSVMKPDLHYVKTVQDNEEPTHERVPQKLVTVPGFENLLPTVLELASREISACEDASSTKRPFKAIVYFNATAEATLASKIFFNIRQAGFPERPDNYRSVTSASTPTLLGDECRVYEIHSRLSQLQRTAAAERFRNAKTAILMSSDVTARGMDFPGVTHVIQIGVPNDRDTYIHRLGRTARAGAEGEGWMILPATALNEARIRLGKLPLEKDQSLEAARPDFSTAVGGPDPDMTAAARNMFATIANAAQQVDPVQKNQMYVSSLGSHQWMKNKEVLISAMNRLAKFQWRMDEPPAIGRALASKLRLNNVPGVLLQSGRDYEGRGGDGGDYYARGGGGANRRDERSSRFSEAREGYPPREERSGGFGERRGGFADTRGGGGRGGGRGVSGGGDRRSVGSFGNDRPSDRGGFGGDRTGSFDRNAERAERSSFGGDSGEAGGRGGDRRGGFGGGDRRGGFGGGDRRGGFGGDRRGGGDRGGFGGGDRRSGGDRGGFGGDRGGDRGGFGGGDRRSGGDRGGFGGDRRGGRGGFGGRGRGGRD